MGCTFSPILQLNQDGGARTVCSCTHVPDKSGIFSSTMSRVPTAERAKMAHTAWWMVRPAESRLCTSRSQSPTLFM